MTNLEPIESEIKRERLQAIITRWCEHTKVTQYLRDHDISSLVSSIVDEFYKVRLCCGHRVADMDEGAHIAFKNGDDVVSGLYCRVCAEKYKRDLGAREVKMDKTKEERIDKVLEECERIIRQAIAECVSKAKAIEGEE